MNKSKVKEIIGTILIVRGVSSVGRHIVRVRALARPVQILMLLLTSWVTTDTILKLSVLVSSSGKKRSTS